VSSKETESDARVNGSIRRLLEHIDTPSLDYYDGASERSVAAALAAWPLLASISRTLVAKRTVNEVSGARFSVVTSADEPTVRFADPPVAPLIAIDEDENEAAGADDRATPLPKQER
jgi:hypothetical protein